MGEIVLDGVTKEFAGGVRAVDGVDMTIADGEFMVLVGPSGCGKTTLLRSIGGLETISAGRIMIDGRDVTGASPSDRDLAMVFQNYALYPHMTVRQNLGYALRVRKTPKKEINRRVEEAAKLLGLDQLLDRRPGALSGGQMQRVAMGRAIVREPKAFLMDEPLSNLDAKLRVSMRTSLQQLHQRIGTTTVYVTHDQVEAMVLGARVAVMRDGKVQQVDAPGRLYEEPANVFVAAFIGSPAMNLAQGVLSDDNIMLGSTSIPLDRERRPVLQPGGRATVGIRPEAFEDAAFASRDLPTIEVRVEVLESIGSDAYVFFHLDAEPVIVEEALSDDGADDGQLLTDNDQALFAARVDSRSNGDLI
ncbi:MAG: sn-glycerol-3-phosphate ABC transporter ATP-binding protein UgpC, partial [Actinobacteria bacterium]|nr:sn-glycerol-3-phosphate ABC transporter ATP-binding protein UgpC [Actinomycetota bacterium]